MAQIQGVRRAAFPFGGFRGEHVSLSSPSLSSMTLTSASVVLLPSLANYHLSHKALVITWDPLP